MKRLTLILAASLLGGCVTTMKSERDTKDTRNGLLYSLPIPVLYVEPQANGTMKVQVEYFADPERTYALRTQSVVSSHTLEVKRNERGLLTFVSFDAKSDAVASAMVESAGNVAKAQADLHKAEQDKADTAAKAAADNVAEAQTELDIAKAKLKVLEDNNVTGDKLLEAKLAEASAKAKLDRLTAAATGSMLVAGNVVPASGPRAAAPVLFRVVPISTTEGPSVRLVAFEGPRDLPTSTIAKPAPQAAAGLTLSAATPTIQRGGATLMLVVISTEALLGVMPDSWTLVSVAGTDEKARVRSVTLDPNDPKRILVGLDGRLGPSTYDFSVAVLRTTTEPVRPASVQFSVSP